MKNIKKNLWIESEKIAFIYFCNFSVILIVFHQTHSLSSSTTTIFANWDAKGYTKSLFFLKSVQVNVKSKQHKINFRLGQCQVHERFVKVFIIKSYKVKGTLCASVFINFTRKFSSSLLSPQIQFRNIKKNVSRSSSMWLEASLSLTHSLTHVYLILHHATFLSRSSVFSWYYHKRISFNVKSSITVEMIIAMLAAVVVAKR